jgi:4-amino-4-deoxychorismate lyase
MYTFIESIKIEDSKIFLLDLHQTRINDTFANLEKENTINLENIFKGLDYDDKGLLKLRIVYDLDGNFKTQIIPYAISEIDDFELVTNNSVDYSFKYENRKELDEMKQKSKAGEIIIVKNNSITDSSLSNLLFKKGKEWFTPSTFLLNGVQRQHLLKEKKIKETEITIQNISNFSHFKLINSMIDFDNAPVYTIEKIKNLPKSDEYLEV